MAFFCSTPKLGSWSFRIYVSPGVNVNFMAILTGTRGHSVHYGVLLGKSVCFKKSSKGKLKCLITHLRV